MLDDWVSRWVWLCNKRLGKVMIEINLVPEQLRKKKKVQPVAKKVRAEGGASRKKFAWLIVLGVFVLLSAHIGLQVFITRKFVQHRDQSQKWEEVEPKKAKADETLQDLKKMRERMNSMEQLSGGVKILWAQKLNEISDGLPRGVWLSRIVLDEEGMTIFGSAVSKNKEEMISVHHFASQLKGNKIVLEHFSDVELGLIKSRKVNITQVADFTIIADLKKEVVEEEKNP